jgi:glycosyltransferase involved in cell wall biosynthesis
MTPSVSVVIACRDAELTLGVQLEALARQEGVDSWNVVISDNGSSDATVATALGYADRLPGLVVVDSSGRAGAGHARNVGAAATRAPLLVFCDADDEVAPGWLAAMVDALREHPFVAGRFDVERLNGARARRSRHLAQDDGLQTSPFGPDLPHAGAGNLGVRRETFLAVGGFDPAVGCLEDTDLCWRIQLHTGVRLVFCPQALVHVRLRSSLRTMWAQGRAYGEASALLTQRYPSPSAPAVRAGRLRRVRALIRLVRLVRDRRSPGALLWSLGWHLGYRRRRDGAPVLSPPGTPAADAA